MPSNQAVPGNLIEYVQRQVALFGRVGCTRVIMAPTVAAIAAGAGNTSVGVNLPFNGVGKGYAIALYGQERTGTVAKFAQTEVRIQTGYSDDIISDGSAGTFAPMLALFGPNMNWFPVTRRITPGVNWTITYRNQDAAAACNPSLAIAFISDADLERISKQVGAEGQ